VRQDGSRAKPDKGDHAMKQFTNKLRQYRLPLWIRAFFVNFLAGMLAIGPFLLAGGGYFAMSHDFSAQEIPFHIFMNRTVKSGNLGWNWAIDLGGNFTECFAFYNLGSIFTWLEFLFPADWMPRVMGWFLILKLAVAGAASAVFFRRHLKRDCTALTASLLYAFCGYQCSAVVFYHFMDMVALFPLMMTGLELLAEEKKKGFFAAACLLNALCNYIFFVSEVFFVILYYLVTYLPEDLRSRRPGRVLLCLWEGMLGCLMSGILLLPAVNGTLSNSRISEYINISDWFRLESQQLLLQLKAFLLPAEPMNRMSSVYGSDWLSNAAYLPLFGILFAVAYAISKKDSLSRMLKLCLFILLVPVCNSLFMLFNSVQYHRWYFMLILLMVLATGHVIEEPSQYKIRQSAVAHVLLLLFFVLLTTGIIRWNYADFRLVFLEGRYWTGVCAAVTGIVLVLLCVYRFPARREKLLFSLTFVFSIFVLSFSVYWYQNTTDNTTIDFRKYENAYAENVADYLTEYAAALSPDILPCRYAFQEGIGHSYYNFAMTNSLPSVNSFISTASSSISEFYDALGPGRATWTNQGPEDTGRLLSVRYYIYLEKALGEDIPETYKFLGTMKNKNGQTAYVYEDEEAPSIGFTYDTYITRSEFDSFREASPGYAARAMIYTLVAADEDAEEVSGCLTHDSVNRRVLSRCAVPAETASSFAAGRNTFTCQITADREKYAFFSVPYDKYWRAGVNGAEEKILNINGLMAVRVQEGDNDIRFEYDYLPGKLGLAVSLCGILMFAGYLVLARHGGFHFRGQ